VPHAAVPGVLIQVFDGEEFSMAARMWTRGYDFYTPDISLIGHDYNRVSGGTAHVCHGLARPCFHGNPHASSRELSAAAASA
jgi:Glycosyltransferase (GlcNAc)